MGVASGGGSKGRPPPNPNNGSGNGLDNSNGVANMAQSAQAQNAVDPTTGQTNPAVTTAMTPPTSTTTTTAQATLAPAANNPTPGTTPAGQYSRGKSGGKGAQPPAAAGTTPTPTPTPAQSTYSATMQAALNGTPATPPDSSMSGQAAATGAAPAPAAGATGTPGGPVGNLMQRLGAKGGATPGMGGAAGSNPTVGTLLGPKGQAKGGQMPGMLGSGTASNGSALAQAQSTSGMGQALSSAGYPTTKAAGFGGQATTDWSKVDPNQLRTANGQAQVMDSTPMFTLAPGSSAEKAANFQFQNPTEPWQKNWNALPPNLRLQYAASSTGTNGNQNQGWEMMAQALQADGGMTKEQTQSLIGAFGASGGAMEAENKRSGITLTDPTNTNAIGGAAIRMEGNTLYRIGPHGQKTPIAQLPYAQPMGREANGAMATYGQSGYGKALADRMSTRVASAAKPPVADTGTDADAAQKAKADADAAAAAATTTPPTTRPTKRTTSPSQQP